MAVKLPCQINCHSVVSVAVVIAGGSVPAFAFVGHHLSINMIYYLVHYFLPSSSEGEVYCQIENMLLSMERAADLPFDDDLLFVFSRPVSSSRHCGRLQSSFLPVTSLRRLTLFAVSLSRPRGTLEQLALAKENRHIQLQLSLLSPSPSLSLVFCLFTAH